MVAGAFGGVAGAGEAGPAEGPLGDAPVGEAAEIRTPVLHIQHLLRRLAGHDLGAGLIGQVVGAFDGVEGVPLPGVVLAFGVIAQRSVDPALGRPGVGAHRVYFGEHSHAAPGGVGLDSRPQPRQPAADD